jgi:hypothetical protein
LERGNQGVRICGDIDDRLQGVVSFDQTPVRDNYLLVIHPNNTDEWIDQELPERLNDNQCRAILLVKGVPRAGLTDEQLAKLKKQYGDRFHVSACAVGTASESSRLAGDLATRFRSFFQHVRSAEDKVDWSILDPQWPDNLFSAYLLARVLSTDTPEANILESQTAEWGPVWEGARKEHQLLTGSSLTPAKLDKSTARDIVKQIAQYLQTVAERVG